MPVAMTDGGVFLFGLIDTTREYTQYQGMDGMEIIVIDIPCEDPEKVEYNSVVIDVCTPITIR